MPVSCGPPGFSVEVFLHSLGGSGENKKTRGQSQGDQDVGPHVPSLDGKRAC